MAAERISKAQRLRAQSVAEKEVMRYAGHHALWHKHVHNSDLDALQVFKMIEMDNHPNTIDFSCRRTGKTVCKELHQLEQNAINPDQELGIVAPREFQSLQNLDIQLDAIMRSPILTAWLGNKGGRVLRSDTYYQFANRSRARAYGIMAQLDGGDLTSASLEEVDDLPRDRLFSRFLLRLGANRKLGASEHSRNKPQIRITGVFKGADTLTDLVSSAKYHVLPTIDAYLGIEMGILDEQFFLDMRAQLSPDEYLRQLLCVNVSARNLIWEKYVRRAMQTGLEAGLRIAEPMPGMQYKKRGLIGLGYDAGGHGENPQSSKHAAVITEQIGNFITFPYVRTWPAGADDMVVMRDLIGIWKYFGPDTAMGDAYGVGMLTQLNDQLYADGLTRIDRRTIGDGSSTASTWPEWPFSPVRFEGMVKHSMAQALRSIFHNRQAALPYLDDADDSLIDSALTDMRMLTRQLPNIVPLKTKTSYASYKMADAKLGDDLFDAAMAAVWGMVTRGVIQLPVQILTGTRKRAQLLERVA